MTLNIAILSRPLVLLSFCILATLSWYAGIKFTEKKIVEIPNLISESMHCITNTGANSEKFAVFITDEAMADKLLAALCNAPSINRQYGQVEVRWSHSELESSLYVGKGIADLVLVKDNFMQVFATQSTHGYQVMGQYQDYSAYFISLKEKPLLTKQYLWGKKLGLLDHPSSRSGHIVPKSLLNTLGIAENNMQITYVKSHEALRDLLASGKVDLISTFWQEQDELRFSANYITPLETKVSGSKWYLKMPTQNIDLLCDVQRALAQLSSEMHSPYYSQLLLSDRGCNVTPPQHQVDHSEK